MSSDFYIAKCLRKCLREAERPIIRGRGEMGSGVPNYILRASSEESMNIIGNYCIWLACISCRYLKLHGRRKSLSQIFGYEVEEWILTRRIYTSQKYAAEAATCRNIGRGWDSLMVKSLHVICIGVTARVEYNVR